MMHDMKNQGHDLVATNGHVPNQLNSIGNEAAMNSDHGHGGVAFTGLGLGGVAFNHGNFPKIVAIHSLSNMTSRACFPNDVNDAQMELTYGIRPAASYPVHSQNMPKLQRNPVNIQHCPIGDTLRPADINQSPGAEGSSRPCHEMTHLSASDALMKAPVPDHLRFDIEEGSVPKRTKDNSHTLKYYGPSQPKINSSSGFFPHNSAQFAKPPSPTPRGNLRQSVAKQPHAFNSAHLSFAGAMLVDENKSQFPYYQSSSAELPNNSAPPLVYTSGVQMNREEHPNLYYGHQAHAANQQPRGNFMTGPFPQRAVQSQNTPTMRQEKQRQCIQKAYERTAQVPADYLKIEYRNMFLHVLNSVADESREKLHLFIRNFLRNNVVNNSLYLLEVVKTSDLEEVTKTKILAITEELIWKVPPRFDLWRDQNNNGTDYSNISMQADAMHQMQQPMMQQMASSPVCLSSPSSCAQVGKFLDTEKQNQDFTGTYYQEAPRSVAENMRAGETVVFKEHPFAPTDLKEHPFAPTKQVNNRDCFETGCSAKSLLANAGSKHDSSCGLAEEIVIMKQEKDTAFKGRVLRTETQNVFINESPQRFNEATYETEMDGRASNTQSSTEEAIPIKVGPMPDDDSPRPLHEYERELFENTIGQYKDINVNQVTQIAEMSLNEEPKREMSKRKRKAKRCDSDETIKRNIFDLFV